MDESAPIILDTGKGLSLKYRGRFFYSSRSPVESVEKRVAALSLDSDCLYLLPSPALGYGLVSLLKKIPSSSHVLCLEIEGPLWRIFQKHNPLKSESDLMSWTFGQTESGLLKKMMALKAWPFRRLKRIDLSGGSSLFRTAYDKWQGFLEREIQSYWKNRMTLIHMGPLWIKNLFRNLPLLEKAEDSASLHTEKPVLVVGAGPGLDSSIEDLKLIRPHLFILAVDTVLPVLMAHSIKPDAVLLLEAQAANLQDFIPQGIPDIPFIADLTSYHPLLREHKGPLYFFISRFAPWKILERLEKEGLLPRIVPALGSVGVAALYLARFITKKAVYFTGLDLAYTFGRSHAKGAPHDLLFHFRANRLENYSTLLFKAIYSRPLIRQGMPGKLMELSDLILLGYADQAREIVSSHPGIFCLSHYGILLGANRVGPEHVREQGAFQDYFEISCQNCVAKKWNKFAIRSFLTNELRLLEEALGVAMAVMDKSLALLGADHLKLLGEVDYVYKSFPDNADFNEHNRAFFLRLAVALRHYIELCR
ncbi:MAG: DUF115 domain-containing protein [Spirochaetales bacterium]|nr:DUF115 domain-containing protein [Spirochaetales bacterium]